MTDIEERMLDLAEIIKYYDRHPDVVPIKDTPQHMAMIADTLMYLLMKTEENSADVSAALAVVGTVVRGEQ